MAKVKATVVDEQDLIKNKVWRAVFRTLFCIVAFLIPAIVMSIELKLFTKFSGYKLGALAAIMVIVIIWRFAKKIMEWVNSWEYSAFKYVIIGFSRIFIFVVMGVMVVATYYGLDKFITCIVWTCVCEAIAYLVIYPLEERFDFMVKRTIRKIERKEDIKEAFSEM